MTPDKELRRLAEEALEPYIRFYARCRIADDDKKLQAYGRAASPAAILALLDRLAECERDARRYRWLRKDRPVLLLTGYFGNGCINRTIEEVDAAIDAALKEPKQ